MKIFESKLNVPRQVCLVINVYKYKKTFQGHFFHNYEDLWPARPIITYYIPIMPFALDFLHTFCNF